MVQDNLTQTSKSNRLSGLNPPGVSPQMQSAQLKNQIPVQIDSNITFLTEQLNTQNRRLRILEERYISLRRNSQVTDQNMLTNYKRVYADIKSASANISELKKKILDIDEKIGIIQSELSVCVKKEDITVLDRYISLWNPSMFLTRTEAENIIGNLLRQSEKGKASEIEKTDSQKQDKASKFLDS